MAPISYEDFSALIGLVGVGLYLVSYAGLQSGWLSANGYGYTLMNFAAASAVMFDLFTHFHLPTALIQTSWICISLIGLLRIYRRNSHKKPWQQPRAALTNNPRRANGQTTY